MYIYTSCYFCFSRKHWLIQQEQNPIQDGELLSLGKKGIGTDKQEVLTVWIMFYFFFNSEANIAKVWQN